MLHYADMMHKQYYCTRTQCTNNKYLLTRRPIAGITIIYCYRVPDISTQPYTDINIQPSLISAPIPTLISAPSPTLISAYSPSLISAPSPTLISNIRAQPYTGISDYSPKMTSAQTYISYTTMTQVVFVNIKIKRK